MARETRAPLPYVRHATDQILALDGGALMCAFFVEGVAFETAGRDELNRLHEALAGAWRNIASEDLAVWQHLIRAPAKVAPSEGFASAYGAELDAAWRGRVNRDGLFANRLIVTLILKGPGLSPWLAGAAVKAAPEGERIRRLEGVARDLMQLLTPWRPRPLGIERRGEVLFSQTLEALVPILEGQDRPMPLVPGHLGQALYAARVIFGREALEIRQPGGSAYGAMLGLKAYPASTHPGIWDGLLAAPYRLIVSQSFAFLSRAAAEGLMGRKQNQMLSANDRAASQADALDEAMDDLASGRFVMGDHQASVLVLADTPAELSRDLSAARALLAGGGLVAAREDLGLEAAFWAQFPGVFKMRTRPAAISSRNFAALAPLHAYASGRHGKPHWDAPVASLRTRGRTTFELNLHVGDLGHTFICGPSGAGKTVLQNFLLAQMERFGARQVLIDKDRGAEVFVRACGGAYQALRSGEPTGLSPLKALGDAPTDLAFLRALVLRMALGADGRVSPSEAAMLDEAIAAVLRLPQRERSIAALRGLLGQQDAAGLGARLERWGQNAALGWALDGDADALDLGPRLSAFDMTSILDDADVRAPVMMYLLHRIGALADGRRLVVCIDEFWKALGDEAFRDLARDGLKTWRKKDAVLVLATQSPSDVLASPIARTIQEQCATKIFLPNGEATELDYGEGFGLSGRELALVRDELGVGSRGFLIRQGGASAVAELDLTGLDEHLAILSGRAATTARLDEIRRQVGDDPAAWREPFRQSLRSFP
ncbi:VirB4 family type IV secretion/conjugal transfer ATPase [Caulobacter sp. NIBR2454]|uniref:VirB4 family type IV secretion/conjugal transfer ATPase n=1 Tax=Caulobacter sp. NIBR2454 TaxID=3015996 RepID=UPI0022B656E5|nr:VirB4 family type IV secretion/conjugal transfer ATPase [Caulobacter sp. NIBR2454]